MLLRWKNRRAIREEQAGVPALEIVEGPPANDNPDKGRNTSMKMVDFGGDNDVYDFDEIKQPELSAVDEIARYRRRVQPWDIQRDGGVQPDLSKDPLDFWRGQTQQFPILQRLARKYLAIPGSSASVERLFSYTGNRVGKKHASMGDDLLLSMMLCRSIRKFLRQFKS